MVHHTRRTFLKVGGTLLGGIAAGSSVVAAESTRRFIVEDRGNAVAGRADLSVVHELAGTDFAVVESTEAALESLGVAFAPDVHLTLDLPVERRAVDEEGAAGGPAYFGYQWDKHSQNVTEAHAHTRGEGTRVAVIDSGVDADHPDLAPVVNRDLSRDFTGDGYGACGPYGGGHGTHVAGIVGASGLGTVGTAPGTEIVDCRVFSGADSGASFGDILAAMVYSAAIGADVANLSIGAYPIPRAGLGSFYGKVLNAVTALCQRNDTLLVVSAGNDAADLQHDGNLRLDVDDDGEAETVSVVSLPNEASNVMSISATGPIGFGWGDAGLESPPSTPAVYTNYGTNAIDVSGPGGNYDMAAYEEYYDGDADMPAWYLDMVINTYSEPVYADDGTYLGARRSWSWLAGTSMAAPNVAGAAALVASVVSNPSATRIRNTLCRTAADVGDSAYHGRGHLDTLAAVTDAL